MNKPIIYQLFPRWFANYNETRKFNGTKEENGCGRFADINERALKAIADMLVNDFGICQDDVISFLVGLTMDELNVVEEGLREKDESPEYGYIVKQLSHPLVYEIVTIQMPALIELGKGLQGKYEWHKEETEVRIY